LASRTPAQGTALHSLSAQLANNPTLCAWVGIEETPPFQRRQPEHQKPIESRKLPERLNHRCINGLGVMDINAHGLAIASLGNSLKTAGRLLPSIHCHFQVSFSAYPICT
jgi:hypothetical protein